MTILRILALIVYTPIAMLMGNNRHIGFRMIMTRPIMEWPSGVLLMPVIAVLVWAFHFLVAY